MSGEPARTPLIIAVEKGDFAAVDRLLKEGVEIDARDASGRTALMAATQRNDVAIAERLIAAGSDVNARDATMLTPYLCAGANGFNKILKLWLFYTRVNRPVAGSRKIPDPPRWPLC